MSPEEMKGLMDQAIKDWDVIRVNPTIFLSNHKGEIGELYRSKLQVSRRRASLEYLLAVCKNLVGIFVTTPNLAWGEPETLGSSVPVTHAVITLAGEKYRYDAERIQIGLRSQGKRCGLFIIGAPQGELIRPGFMNRVQGAGIYLRSCLALYRKAWGSGRKLLLASHTLSAIRNDSMIHTTLQHQPRMHDLEKVISIVPFNQLSRSLTKACDFKNIKTYALRTQTVYHASSHVAINTQFLFYRTEHEREVYENLRPLLACELIPGGIYNFPPPADPVHSPTETRTGYVLILGTAPANHETFEQWQVQTRKIIKIARGVGKDIIYKSHNLAVDWDVKILASEFPEISHFTKISNNRGLIDNAGFVLTFPSTLLYYILNIEKPFILISNAIHSPHEFSLLSVVEINLEDGISTVDLTEITQASAEASKRFIKNNKPVQNEKLLLTELIDAA